MEKVQDRVLLVGGSPRRGGNSDLLLEAVAQGVRDQGLEAEIVHLRDHQYQPCMGCERCRRDLICTRLQDGMTLLYPRIEAARGLVLASPVHNYNVTSWIKAFIDRLYCYYDFSEPRPGPWSSRLAGQGRQALVLAVAEQREKKETGVVLEAMEWPLQALGYQVLASHRVLGVFARGGVRKRGEVLDEVTGLGSRLAKSLRDPGSAKD